MSWVHDSLMAAVIERSEGPSRDGGRQRDEVGDVTSLPNPMRQEASGFARRRLMGEARAADRPGRSYT